MKLRETLVQANEIALIITIMICITLLSSCGTKRNEVELTTGEEEFMRELSAFEDKDKDKMNKYMYVYITYRDSGIPDKEFNFIRSNTEDSLFESRVQFNFIRGTDKGYGISDEEIEQYFNAPEGQELQRDGNGKYIIDGLEDIREDYEIPERSDLNIERFYYFYTDNTYGAKVSNRYGLTSTIYFEVRDKKVVNIYEH